MGRAPPASQNILSGQSIGMAHKKFAKKSRLTTVLRPVAVVSTKALKAGTTKRQPRGKAFRKGKPLRRLHAKTTLRQQGLGGQTIIRHRMASRPDTRARVMKAMGVPSFYNTAVAFSESAPSTGIQFIDGIGWANQSNLASIGNQIANSQGLGANGGIARFLLENVNSHFEFMNRSTAPATIKIFLCRAKRDCWNPPSGNAADSMVYNTPAGGAYPWDGTPIEAFREGINAASGQPSGSTGPFQTLGVHPTESKLFTDYFRIMKEQEVVLSQGGRHIYDLNVHYDKVIDGSVYANSPLNQIMNVTNYVFWIVQGSPAFDLAGEVNTSTTLPALAISVAHEYRFTTILSQNSNASVFNSVVQVTPSTNLAQVNPGKGEVDYVAIA